MHLALSIEEGKRYGPALLRAKQSPEKDCTMGNLITLYKVPAKPQGWFQEELAKKKKVLFRFSALRYLWAILFLFVSSEVTKQIKTVRPLSETKSLSHLCSLPNHSQNGSCAPYVEVTTYLLSCLLERKEEKLCFCHWFSHMKLISSPFSGSEAAVSQSAISLCFVSVSAGEILNSLCTKLFLNFI